MGVRLPSSGCLPALDGVFRRLGPARSCLQLAWKRSRAQLWYLACWGICFYNKRKKTLVLQLVWAQGHRSMVLRHLLHTEQIRRVTCRAKA